MEGKKCLCGHICALFAFHLFCSLQLWFFVYVLITFLWLIYAHEMGVGGNKKRGLLLLPLKGKLG